MQVVFTLVFPSVNQSLVLRALELGGWNSWPRAYSTPTSSPSFFPSKGHLLP